MDGRQAIRSTLWLSIVFMPVCLIEKPDSDTHAMQLLTILIVLQGSLVRKHFLFEIRKINQFLKESWYQSQRILLFVTVQQRGFVKRDQSGCQDVFQIKFVTLMFIVLYTIEPFLN